MTAPPLPFKPASPRSRRPSLRRGHRRASGAAGSSYSRATREFSAKTSTVDIMFAIDCTASMQGEINGIKDAVIEFAEIIETDGIDMRLGLIEYRDRLHSEEHRLCRWSIPGAFTRDIPQFREEVSLLDARGGGDRPESTFDAILLAMRSIEDTGRTNALVVITDAPPKIPDKECSGTKEIVVNIREMNLDQLYILFPLEDRECNVYYELLSEVTGEALEIRDGGGGAGGRDKFYQTLLDLSRTITEYTKLGSD